MRQFKKRNAQTSFAFVKDYKKEFGGELLLGKRKTRRPLSTKKPVHLVLRANQGGLFSPSNRSLERLIRAQAKRFSIKVYEFALNWSHIHMVIRLRDRKDYLGFIRSLTAILAMKAQRKIFDLRPYTRVIEWGRGFKAVMHYQILNQLEARGLVHRSKPANFARLTLRPESRDVEKLLVFPV